MSTVWYAVLGLLFMAYFALGGLDQGVALLLPRHRGDAAKRAALNAVGPRFLGNEVWIVGAVGVLVAAFPRLEGELFGAAYPVVVAVVLGLIALNAGVQLRGRTARPGGFDALITAGAAALAVGWGLLLGVVLHGVPMTADGHVHGFAPLSSPAVWLTALVNVVLVVANGAAYLAWRGDPANRRVLDVAAPAGAGLVVLSAVVWSWQEPPGVRNPLLAAALAAVTAGALLAARYLTGGRAVTATLVACALPVITVALARYPGVLASTMDPGATVTVDSAAAGGDTLRLLAIGAAPLLPVLAAVQIACWWLFGRRESRPTPLYW
ncbi:cytochrome d ubiquinol oxidase subunit II [Dactylosporangium aurantiacum]|uniref:Cytochrome d ubiquinol oxidase subunit II n=1 Tax=Dactylosporangium aurantiacum TaxID=35754 RepID=A0A9Q9MP38_9ACTN|nr:cytochrome d ubiquinol oxidase subunit II [Dactylosporangium aurantiacum]MDG6109773.1 cytochrome d ubiquinol oxidase subunit II [Dactylosporangium aurantiacum]UWZ56292.1 cytochrome d ubiquinol oxidase subunit II [Dactylosporangium aurantiacum]